MQQIHNSCGQTIASGADVFPPVAMNTNKNIALRKIVQPGKRTQGKPPGKKCTAKCEFAGHVRNPLRKKIAADEINDCRLSEKRNECKQKNRYRRKKFCI